jgi:CRISPR system Cascade subunit CasB
MLDDKPKEPDYLDLCKKFKILNSGAQAQLRRISEPEGLREIPAFYRLFPNDSPKDRDGRLRVAFLLPWLEDCGEQRRESVPAFGKLLAQAHISEMRVFQVARASPPSDIIQLRRLAIQLKRLKHPKLDWQKFGSMLYYWSTEQKRRLVESYFLSQSTIPDQQEIDHEQ